MTTLITTYLVFLTFCLSWTSGYKITFYTSDICTGEEFGNWVGGPDQGCRQDFAGQASGVVVQSTGAIDNKTEVQFYSSSDCSVGTETSVTETGCIAVEADKLGTFGSFRVLHTLVSPFIPLTDIDPSTLSDNNTSTDVDADLEPATVTERREIPYLEKRRSNHESINSKPYRREVYHGLTTSLDGVEYRWHQIFDGGFTGVLAQEWNDTIHVPERRSLASISEAAGIPHGTFDRVRRTLETRDLDKRILLDLCQRIQTCAVDAVDTAVALAPLIKPVLELMWEWTSAKGRTMFEFIGQNPFAASTAANIVGGSAVAVIFLNKGSDIKGVEACSTITTTLDDINKGIAEINQVLGPLAAAKAQDAQNIAQILEINLRQLDVLQQILVSMTPHADALSAVTVDLAEQDASDRFFRVSANVDGCSDVTIGDLCQEATGFCPTRTINGRYKWL